MTTLTPHGECLLWTPELIWVNAVSDLLISFAFFAIAFVLAYIVYRRRDFQFSYIFWAFALFVSICGMTRLIEVLTIWIPAYVLEAATKGFLAFISVGIAAALLLMLPRVLTMPSRAELRLAYAQLEEETRQRRTAEAMVKRFQEIEATEAQVRQAQKMEAIGQLT